jgi:hypothetical protein
MIVPDLGATKPGIELHCLDAVTAEVESKDFHSPSLL